jgi:hypothetical protein
MQIRIFEACAKLTFCDSSGGTAFALRVRGKRMVPIVSLIGCLLIAVGVWGSAVAMSKDRPRF